MGFEWVGDTSYFKQLKQRNKVSKYVKVYSTVHFLKINGLDLNE